MPAHSSRRRYAGRPSGDRPGVDPRAGNVAAPSMPACSACHTALDQEQPSASSAGGRRRSSGGAGGVRPSDAVLQRSERQRTEATTSCVRRVYPRLRLLGSDLANLTSEALHEALSNHKHNVNSKARVGLIGKSSM